MAQIKRVMEKVDGAIENIKEVDRLISGMIGDGTPMTDAVNHPAHYAESCSLECLQVMEMAFGLEAVAHFCLGNAFKYMWRHKHKGKPQEDLAKARFYLDYVGDSDRVSELGSDDVQLYSRLCQLLEKCTCTLGNVGV